MVAMHRQPRRKRSRKAALRAQGLVVAYLALTVIPWRNTKPVRPEGEKRTRTKSLGFVEIGRIFAAADFMRRVGAQESEIRQEAEASERPPRRAHAPSEARRAVSS